MTSFSLGLLATHCDWMHFHTEITTKNDASLINANGKTASRSEIGRGGGEEEEVDAAAAAMLRFATANGNEIWQKC